MKQRILIAILALTSFSIVSCNKDYLDTSSPSEFTSDLVFTSPTYTDYAVTGIYALLTQDQMYSARLSLNYATNSDIEIVGADANSYKENTNRGLSNYLGTPDNNSISREWTLIYKMIERANLCIDGIKKSPVMSTADSTKMKAYLGEALTLRALAYFELVKNWGDVPYKAEPTKFDLSNVYLPVTDRDTIYDNIIADLLEAEKYVPWVKQGNYTSVERVTKGFIKGLTARIALFRGGYSIRNKPGFPTERGSDWRKYYQLANQKCSEVMQQGVHQLNNNYIDVWKKLCRLELDGTFNENLFEVAHGLGRSGEMGYSIGIRFYTNAKYGFGNNANVVNTTAYYFYMFDAKDIRRDNTIAYYTYSNSAGDVKEIFQTNPLSYNFAKWDQRFMGEKWSALNKAAQGKFGYGINWAVMRYSDILLMFAETENALNGAPTAAAKLALKQVRRRAFIEADRPAKVEAYVDALNSESAFFNAIVDERAFEFGGEAIRKYDLIRWNLLTAKIQKQRDDFKKMLAGTAPYDALPKFLFYKYETNNEILEKSTINFYTDRGAVDIAGFTRIPWLSGSTAANITSYIERIDLFSSGLNSAGVENRHLYPIPNSVISESQGTLKNGYNF
ncbi:RagB/SusD family nutrient uptake outer membrane protein [Pedobacter puniceum]|nr:RagB/SusD family nutrient uptake outer membrane protein [Pedobacter puniceum]